MTLRTVWQRLTRLRMPPRSQPSAPSLSGPAAATDPLGKQRRGYSDKMLRPLADYEDKSRRRECHS